MVRSIRTNDHGDGSSDPSSDDCDHGNRPHDPIDTYEDHRMALSFAPAAFRLPQLQINNPQVVSKSYPKFWENLKAAGFVV